ncbi:WD40 repeat-like protein [Auriculariales sp. MPI-PUGE-AT-0066]|nr:WD40 repeat-like protein [Auriculariales sp. MPI-PUGE-AT-0066]
MSSLSELERLREENIAKNRQLLEELNLANVNSADELGVPSTSTTTTKAKPVQPRKLKRKADEEEATPRRASTRLRRSVHFTNETPEERHEREEKEEEQRLQDEVAVSLPISLRCRRFLTSVLQRIEADDRERKAKKPRHEQLDLATLGRELSDEELSSLRSSVRVVLDSLHKLQVGDNEKQWDWDESSESEHPDLTALKAACKSMRVVSRAKVTQDRVYSMAYHPERTKDLIFFGDKHGQLGIWDARAPPEEVLDEDGDPIPSEEGGRNWRLQPHWPPTSKSSISSIKFDPLDAHSLFTTAYDCTVRQWSFTSGMSRELLSLEDSLISCVDVVPTGNELWISDTDGGLTHMDVRQHKSQARRFQLSEQKIGSVSINPQQHNMLLTASNSRSLKIWDARKLNQIPFDSVSVGGPRPPTEEVYPIEIEFDTIQEFLKTKKGNGTVKGDWAHGQSVSAAYWNATGRFIVSTCYDNNLRYWNVWPKELSKDGPLKTFKPAGQVSHDCQTGRWLSVFKAQWSPNPEAYPHFTVGNMKHSLDIVTFKGDVVAKLHDKEKITAVQAVTASHSSLLARAASGNGSGRCVLWADTDTE